MIPAWRWRLGSLALAALLCAAGCRQQPTALAPVTGKVAYKGMSVPGGVIVFAPDTSRGESGPVCVGRIKDDGTYTLFSGDAQGAPAGWYRVAVAALAPPPPGADPDRLPPAIAVVPDKYRDPTLSLLACEVRGDRANQLDFNLD